MKVLVQPVRSFSCQVGIDDEIFFSTRSIELAVHIDRTAKGDVALLRPDGSNRLASSCERAVAGDVTLFRQDSEGSDCRDVAIQLDALERLDAGLLFACICNERTFLKDEAAVL